ncbi:hypothetical protein N8T08_001268 [Aspergillus melleus]|uniref:Uncharacterized protein n=1 Tax=Aspergillus melleus TaxID=138277 RepID=A0ACC3ANK5_9EURO|nr:hypothetical protein N8T08_001268 [Aspergillus melleus]
MLESRLEQTTLLKLQGREMLIGTNTYQLVELFAERVVPEMLERHSHFVARRGSDNLMCMIKLCFQSHPGRATDDEVAACAAWGKKQLERDIRALQVTESIVETPYLLEHAILRQDDIHEYPGGYISAIVMSKMPGKPADEYDGLTTSERSLIKGRVTSILESMRLVGWKMSEGYPELVVYDRSTGNVSITGLNRGSELDPNRTVPITEDSSLVNGFGQDIWWE